MEEENIVISPSISSFKRVDNPESKKCDIDECNNIAMYKLERVMIFNPFGSKHLPSQGVRCEEHKTTYFV